jgi:UDP-N-acetylmuramyl pentapeptide synthase
VPYNPRIEIRLIALGLALIGALSPLLTFAALFQQKEWRWDRLREHLRHEGLWLQIFGKIQPILLVLWIAAWFGLPLYRSEVFGVTLGVFALKTGAQVSFNRQRVPTRTSKAIAIVGLSTIFSVVIAYFLPLELLPILPPLEPLIVMIAWAVLLPVDRYLKNSIFRNAGIVRDRWHDATVIGIAGSVGKTTTKELLRHLLQDMNPLATPEHVNTEMGVAQWILNQTAPDSPPPPAPPPRPRVERGADRKGESARRGSFVKPTIGVMTALGSDHLALFGSEEAIVEANAELLSALPQNGRAFLYADNEATRTTAESCPSPVTLCGIWDGASTKATNAKQTDDGISFTMESMTYEVALHGLHNVGNVAVAIAVAEYLGISKDRIRELLKTFQPLKHTFHVRKEQGVTMLDDTYNSSRLSVTAALEWAAKRKEKLKILLMSDLQEAGTDEDRFLEDLGKKASTTIDRTIFTTETGRKAFEKGFGKPVELLSSSTQKIAPKSLLLCIGRMSPASIKKLLPL